MGRIENLLEVKLESCEEINLDFIVIGSGAAGVAAALTLAEQGANILILESGPLSLLEHTGSLHIRHQPEILKKIAEMFSTFAAWESNHASKISQEQVWSVVGGRTLFWGGHSPRFMPADFSLWPIHYEELDSDYVWAENLLHIATDFFSNETQKNLINTLHAHQINVQPSPLALEFKPHSPSTLPNLVSSSISHLFSSKKFSADIFQTGIHLTSEASVRKLFFNQNKITGIDVYDGKQKRRVKLTAKNYVLCCGALRSTELVLRSSLPVSCPKLAKFIGEHLFIKGLIRLDDPLPEPIYLYVPPALDQPFMFEIQGAFNRTWYDANYATVWLDWEKNTRYLLLYAFGVAEVREENALSLSKDPLGYRVNYHLSQQDKKTFNDMRSFAEKIAKALGGKIEKLENQPPGSSLHERGGLTMGKTAQAGVVDTRGKFWDYENLFCADAAIWPNQGAANSCLTITAVAHHVMKKSSL